MFIYVVLEALVGIIAGVMIAKRTKKADGVVYGRLDNAGRITNVLLAVIYAIAAPLYIFLGAISVPDGEGALIILGVLVAVIAASASLFCSLGLGLSIALRKKGKSALSFAVQFAGVLGIVLTLLICIVFEGSLIRPLN